MTGMQINNKRKQSIKIFFSFEGETKQWYLQHLQDMIIWTIIHKMDRFSSVLYNNKYVALLNKAYSEKFENLKQYNNENNFKKNIK